MGVFPGRAVDLLDVLVHVFDPGGMELLGRWWNGVWGRLARRDVWLTREARWQVVARQGDSETGRVLQWEFATEAEARRMVERLLAADSGGGWRELEGRAATPPPAT